MSLLRWRAAAALAVVLGLVGCVAAVTPTAAQAAPIDDAKAKVADAQHAADAAAARYEDAVGQVEQLDGQIDDLRARIAAGHVEVARLGTLARRRAVEAYTGRDGLGEAAFVLDGGDPLDGIRREKLLARTKQEEDDAAARLQTVTDDLVHDRAQLQKRRAEQQQALEQAQAEQTVVQAQLHDAQTALDALEEQLRREADEQRARELAAAEARAASNRVTGKDYGGAFVSTGIICPVRGAVSFVDSYGAPRHQGPHEGVDLMAAVGTPDVAVVSGTVDFREGAMSGLGAFLQGDDGNLYYYFHLSAYEGSARRVNQGDVIGYVGNTGDAQYTASHTHFEIHPGGGGPVNPYPSVAAVC
jgi:peptidoglycan LD-endopeptidase LytH